MRYLGTTRVVVPYKGRVYKIARIRPLKTILKIIAVAFLPSHRSSLAQKYDSNFQKAVWKYLFAGFYANWAECQYWSETQSQHCAPVLNQHFGGLIITQTRAKPVTNEEAALENKYFR